MNDTLKKTPLTDWHTANGAKTAPFAGWEMPIQYTSIITEHCHTREKAAIFDICHMGEFIVSGEQATEALARLTTHNYATLPVGRCRYGFMLNEDGGVIDDLIVYRLAENEFMLVVNGACEECDIEWITSHSPDSVTVENASARTAKIDLQGPRSIDVLEAVFGQSFRDLPYFAFTHADFADAQVLVSRTGYTGELGYELYLDSPSALPLWEALAAHDDVQPVGLGARDTLRLEAGLPLYGHELDTVHTPVEAGFGPMITSEVEFIGKQALGTVNSRLIGLAFEGRRAARQFDIVLADGCEAGVVTSGSFGPSLGHAIAFAWIDADVAEDATLTVKSRKNELPAKRVKTPFYKHGTARKKLG